MSGDLLSRLSPDERAVVFERLLAKRSAAGGGSAAGPAAIPRRPKPAEPAPLSFSQRRLWFLDRLEPGDPSYNVPVAIRIRGPFDPGSLRRALQEVVDRHEALRTTFRMDGGEPVQEVAPRLEVALPVLDLEGVGEEGEVARVFREEARRRFDLATGPLLRAALARRGPRDHALLLTMHHIVSDGWSMSVLVREVIAAYSAFARGDEGPGLPPLPIQYGDYAVWQRGWLQGERLEAQIGYWRRRLAGHSGVLDLPTDRPRPPRRSSRGGHLPVRIDGATVRRLRETVREEKATLFVALLAGFQGLLHRVTGEEDLVVGTPVANRERPETAGLIGFFVNTLALRGDLSGDPGYRGLLGRLRQVAVEAYSHQDLPFDRVVEELRPERDPSRPPIFQVMLALQNAPVAAMEVDDLSLEPLELATGAAQLDLTFSLQETRDGGVAGLLEFNADLFERSSAARIAGHYATLLAGAAADPARRISELPVLTPGERSQVLDEWSAGATAGRQAAPGFLELFAERVRERPDAVAVDAGDECWTYRQLAAKADGVARALRGLGVATDVLVGIRAERSPSLIAALLGVLEAGGAFLPLDPSYPPERLAFMLEDSAVPLILSQGGPAGEPAGSRARVLPLEEVPEGGPRGGLPAAGGPPDGLAYVLYTSGSTGRPKGVLVSRRGLANLAVEQASRFGLAPGGRMLQFASPSFDAAVAEVLATLGSGATLVLARRDELMPGPDLTALLRERGVTTVTLPPSALAVMRDGEGLSSLASLVVAGEACPEPLARSWSRGRRLFNAYGPTEATVCATIAGPEELGGIPGGRVSVGRPLPGVEVFVLDRRLRALPAGVPGELCIGGPGLARGYLGRPGPTAERFVPHPFAARPGERLYRTGDLARWLADGHLDLIGRVDRQVKIRGVRVEPGEVEGALAEHPQVREAAVVAVTTGQEPRLVAFLVPGEGAAPSPAELRSFLAARLPEAYLPAGFLNLQTLPVAPGGKVDRRALEISAGGAARAQRAFVAPRTGVERLLADLWIEALGLDPATARVGAEDDFFDLGGHSLLATRLASRFGDVFGVELPLKVLFEHPTLAAQAAEIENARGRGATPAAPVRPVDRGRPLPLSFSQERLWFLDRLTPGTATYNIPGPVRLRGPLKAAVLERCFAEILRRHEALRTRFLLRDGSPVQVIDPPAPGALSRVDLTSLPVERRRPEADRVAELEAVAPFDLERGPLFRPILVQVREAGSVEGEHLLLLTLHHVVSDGWSMGVLFHELTALYEAFATGRPSPLPELPVQYGDFACWQREKLSGEEYRSQVSYWRERLAGHPPALELPLDRPRPPVQTFRGASLPARIPREVVRSLRELGRAEEASLFMVLLAGLKLVLARLAGQADVLVGSPVAGRNRAELEGLIGFFLNTLVLRTDLSGNPSFRALVRRVREAALGAYAHQDLPFERLLDELKIERDLSRTPLFQVFLNMLNLPPSRAKLPGGLSVEGIALGEGDAKFDLTLYVAEDGDGASLNLVYNAGLFERPRMEELLRQVRSALEQAASRPGAPIGELSLLTPEAAAILPDPAAPLGDEWVGAVHERFAERARRHPERPAVEDGEGVWSYGAFAEAAGRLAAGLRQAGVGRGDRVAVFAHRSAPLAWAVLGTLEAGAAFVMLDPAYPAPRLVEMLRIAEPRAFLALAAAGPVPAEVEELLAARRAAGELCCRLSLPGGGPAGAAAFLADLPADLPAENGPIEPIGPDDLAYVAFTSGSTGVPKGILGRHGPLSHFLPWQAERFDLREDDRYSLLSGLAHDPLQRDLFTPLCLGGTVSVPSVEEVATPGRLAGWMARQRITVAHLTPAMGQILSDPGPARVPTLRWVLLVGDVLTRLDVDRLRAVAPNATCVNLYGSTETQRAVGFHQVAGPAPAGGGERAQQVLPLGRGMRDVQLLVLRRGAAPGLAGIGEVGEIGVRSPHLAAGYLGDEALTRERFIANPFTGRPGDRVYRTGDLGRYLPDGEVAFAGRADQQVKIRGFRIELGEIEAALGRLPGVREAVVLARQDAPEPSSKRLVAYVVPAPGSAAGPAAWREGLRARLPLYMVPAAFVTLERLPVTPNGKVDRRALPAPEGLDASLEGSHVEPESELERRIAEVWKEVLGLPKVGVEHNFFDLGGHSLLLVRLHARLQEALGKKAARELTLVDLFNYPNVRALAGHLSRQGPAAAGLDAAKRRAERPGLGRIAVVGMAGRFPRARDLQELWRNLREGLDCVSRFRDDELEPRPPEELLRNPGYVKARGVLDDVERFDASFFGISPREAELMDPQNRLFLECAWHALEDAGYAPERCPGAVGVFGGVTLSSYFLHHLQTNPEALATASPYQIVLGTDRDYLTTFASYKLNLRGPSLDVQTACSTSLVAAVLACQSLLSHGCDLALAGGVSIKLPQKTGYLYTPGGLDSLQGKCRAFDASADGSVYGSGVGVVALKRLEDALADGDEIYGVILGSALNNDGSAKVGFTAPGVDGQAEVIAQAQAAAGIDPATVGYVECHGSGTALGDPIEVAALTKAFRAGAAGELPRNACALGSVKSNLGHCSAAAGVAGLIKAVLALSHREIPPSLHYERPNPAIDFANGPFYVAARRADWPSDGTPRRAGVSSFGLGGTNAHVVLEEAPEPEPSGPSRPWQLLLLSARSDAALEAATGNLAADLEAHPDRPLADVAFTLRVGRREFPHRRMLVAASTEEARRALAVRDPRRLLGGVADEGRRPVAFLLPGVGDHYPGMARGLYETEPAFQEAFDRCAELLRPRLGRDLREIVLPAGGGEGGAGSPDLRAGSPDLRALLGRSGGGPRRSELDRTLYAQPAVFAVEYALAELWAEWGVRPEALLGYSLGELVAACLAGVLSLEDALTLVAGRARLIDALPAGAMLAVSLPEERLRPLLDGTELDVAAVTAPEVCVAAGSEEEVEALRERLAGAGVSCRRLPTTHAFHSRRMEPVAGELARLARGLTLSPPKIPYVSNVTGTWATAAEATDPESWVRHLLRPVRFAAGLAALTANPARVLLEVGPGFGLSTLALQQAGGPSGDAELVALPSLRNEHDPRPDGAFLLEALGKLWLSGVEVEWNGFHARERRRRVRLPLYPFERRRFWIEPWSAGAAAPADERFRLAGGERVGFDQALDRALESARAGDAPLEVLEDAALLRRFARLRELESLGVRILPAPAPGPAAEEGGPAGSPRRPARSRHDRPNLRTAWVAPEGEVQRCLAELFEDLLGIQGVGAHDSFFELGGHSLLGTSLLSRLRDERGVELPLRRLFEEPTVAGLAAALSEVAETAGAPAAPPPLLPRPRTGEVPPSHAQQRLWFLDRLVPGNPFYNLSGGVRLTGALDVAALRAAVGALIRRHETLRTGFEDVGGRPVQRIVPEVDAHLAILDLSALPAEERGAAVARLAAENARAPFDLRRPGLLRLAVLRLRAEPPAEHVLLFAIHHIVSDAWSMGVLIGELAALYGAFARGEPSPLPPLPVQYADYALWQRSWLVGEALERQIDYWRRRLAGAATLELPADRPRPAVQSFRGATLRVEQPGLSRPLGELAGGRGLSSFMVLLAAFQAWLLRVAGEEDVVVGAPIANRTRRGVEGLIGFFVNTLVLRADLSGDPSFDELLSRVREVCLGAYTHQDLPFEQLVEELQPRRDLSRNPLFQVALNLLNAPPPRLDATGDLAMEPLASAGEISLFDLQAYVTESPEALAIGWEYSTDLFDRATALRFAGGFEALLRGALAEPGRRLSELPVLSPAERHQLLADWNDAAVRWPESEQALLLHEAVAARAALDPRAPAVSFDGAVLSYAELDARANRLARHLRDLGCGPEDRVAVALERSLELVIALLAVLKAGAAYVPLDPDYPRERLARMLEDARPAALITREPLGARLPAAEVPVLCLEPDGAESARYAADPLRGSFGDDGGLGLAYMIFTSGSTGRPKGAMVHHRGIRNRLLWMQGAYRLGPGDVVLQKTPFSFDVSVWELFWPLAAGARLAVARPGEHRDAAALARRIRDEGVTVLHFVPSMLQLFLEQPDLAESCRSVRLVVASGEALTPELERRFFERLPGARLENLYGPTEASVDVTAHRCSPAGGRAVPIGRPIANTRIHLLERRGSPAPLGSPGELHIGGANVGRGYFGRPGLTAEKFVPDPFAAEPGARLYRTGDLARHLPDGGIDFLGRIDHQVKLRGFRIELGEVESALSAHPRVREAVAGVRAAGDSGQDRLVAWLVPEGEGSLGPEAVAELKAWLGTRLPEPMVPAAFVALAELPLSPNGKLDRRALPDPGGERPGGVAPFEPPTTETETTLAALWSALLGVERVGRRDDFFELGGHSLLATQMLARVRDALGVELPLPSVFQEKTLERVAARLDRERRSPETAAPPAPRLQPRRRGKNLEALLASVQDLPEAEVREMLRRKKAAALEGNPHE